MSRLASTLALTMLAGCAAFVACVCVAMAGEPIGWLRLAALPMALACYAVALNAAALAVATHKKG